MIKAKMESNDGRGMLLIGLSRENVTSLKEGKPLHILGSDLGLENDVLLIYGETEDTLFNDLKPYLSAESHVEDSTSKTIQ